MVPARSVDPSWTVLDVGCGTGRHAFHLARLGASVLAADVSSAACEAVLARRKGSDLARLIQVEQGRVDSNSIPDGRFDLIIDSYATCHVLDPLERDLLLDRLCARLKPGGALFTSAMGSDDRYYSPLASRGQATDPLNGVTKLLRDRQTFRAELGELGKPLGAASIRFDDEVDGVVHQREVVTGLIRR